MEIQAATVTATVATTVLSTVFVDNPINTPPIYLVIAISFASLVVSILSLVAAFLIAIAYKGYKDWKEKMEQEIKKLDSKVASLTQGSMRPEIDQDFF